MRNFSRIKPSSVTISYSGIDCEKKAGFRADTMMTSKRSRQLMPEGRNLSNTCIQTVQHPTRSTMETLHANRRHGSGLDWKEEKEYGERVEDMQQKWTH